MILTDPPVNKSPSKKNTWGRGNEEIRQSLDVLDKVLSEFDDIETDTGDDESVTVVTETDDTIENGAEESDETITGAAPPPPVDRTLKPQSAIPPAIPQKVRDKTIKQISNESEGSFHISSDNSHEYQEINSDLMRRDSPDNRKDERRRKSTDDKKIDARSRRQMQRDLHGSSSDITTLEQPNKPRPTKEEILLRQNIPNTARAKETPHLRKSRSDANFDRRDMEMNRRTNKKAPRRSKSSDRLLEHDLRDELEGMPFDPQMDPRLMDPRLFDPRLVDPRLYDQYAMDPMYPMEDIRFPHILGYPPLPRSNTIPLDHPQSMHDLPPLDYPPGYPMMPYEYPPFMSEQFVPRDIPTVYDPILIGPPPGSLPMEMGPDFPPGYPMGLPMDYPIDYPMEYGPYPPNLLPWNMARPDGPWMPNGESQMMMDPDGRIAHGQDMDDICDLTRGPKSDPRMVPRSGRRLTSVGHSDSSERSSPLDERNSRGSRWREPRTAGGVSEGTTTSGGVGGGGMFRVGQPVRSTSVNEDVGATSASHVTRAMTSSVSMPYFNNGDDVPVSLAATGKGFGYPEPMRHDIHGFNSMGRHKMAPGGSGFIVSGVFNDSSKMYIPAPPSPIPDYDDDDVQSDGNESDILQDSQFYVVNEENNKKKNSKGSPHKNNSKERSEKRKTGQSPLQNMIHKFHQKLPQLDAKDEESRFSDDSLEGSSAIQSSASGSTRHHIKKRANSLESLNSIEESTTSFDYVTSKHSTKETIYPIITGGDNRMFKSNTHQKKPYSKSKSEIGLNKSTSSSKVTRNVKTQRQESKESNKSSTSSSSKQSEGFDTVRHLLENGLIDGLDETPPSFKPESPSKKTVSSSNSEDRTDSGLGSNRTDESGISDNHSDPSTSPSSIVNSIADTQILSGSKKIENTNEGPTKKQPVHDLPRNNNKSRPNVDDDSPPPPLPPPRDSSMNQSNSSNNNNSWLHNNKKTTAPTISNYYGKKPAVPPPRSEMLEVPHSSLYSRNPGKITHIDDVYQANQDQNNYDQDKDDNPLTDREFLENLKNLESNIKPEKNNFISEDRSSIGSRSSTRSSRFLSRITDSMKSNMGSRPSTPSNTTKTTTKLTSSSRSSTRLHADVIREPSRQPSGVLPYPAEYQQLVSPSTIVPLSRDGSGRFRSIEDLAESASIARSEGEDITEKRKKHSTLPPNLTPADMKRENKELRRATSLMCSNKGKDENDSGSRFKFNIFKGLWRRRQYSFDNKM